MRFTGFHTKLATLASTALILAALPASTFAAERVWSQTYPLDSGGSVSLSNINGGVTIIGSERRDVEVTATITSRSEEGLNRVDVEVSANSNHIKIETDYSKQRGRWNQDGATVEYVLKVPTGARLEEIDLVNGSLEISNISGNIETSLVNGNLNAEGLAGSIELETVNGSVDVSFNRVSSSQRIEIESVNGPIDIYLPSDVDAEIEASTVHGRIRNDFGLKVEKGEYVGNDMSGTLGSGGARISLENVNGSIEVHRR